MDDVASEGASTLDDDWVKASDECSPTSSLNKNDSSISVSDSSGTPPVLIESRGIRWARLLGVLNRPNPNDFEWDHLYNLRSQSLLRNDCRQLAKRIDNVKSVPELESFFTLYCKMRHMDYTRGAGWIEVFEKLVRVDMPYDTFFHVFYAITTKFVPRDTRKHSAIYDLFRLILQYHDPAVCTKLETLKCTPFSYAKDWFTSLYAAHMGEKACHALWTAYFEKGDPFLIFHMSLALLVNARDAILEFKMEDRDKLPDFLEKLPGSMTESDAADLIDVALFYSLRTPQCVKEDFHCMIFGANHVDEFNEVSLSKLICFPISIQELNRRDRISASQTVIQYFVVDARQTVLFRKGNVPGSFSLDCQLMVDAPEQFSIAMSSLRKYKSEQRPEDHYCFIGYGDELLDQHMVMVLAKFLADGTPHISMLDGGFAALHSHHASLNQLDRLAGHTEATCDICGGGGAVGGHGGMLSLVSRLSKAVVSKGSSVKGRVSEMVSSRSMPGEIATHVSAKDRHGKKYRSQQAMFSIDGSSGEEDEVPAPSVHSKKADGKERLLLSSFLAQPEVIESFECHELVGDAQLPGHIALTRTHMQILHDCHDKAGYVTTSARRLLSSVYNVSCKRRIPEVLTFKFGYESAPGDARITAIHRFFIPKAGDCAKAVKTAIYAIRPAGDEFDDY